MSVLAFKALSVGADKIPDKFFEKIPGGYFTPQEQKDYDKGRKDRKEPEKDKARHRSEERHSKRTSQRERSLATDHSDYYSDYDSEYERERQRRKRERRRAKSAGRSSARSLSRRRRSRDNSDLDGQHSDPRDMAQPEQGQPYFPPPPTSEYKPYNPQEYASSPGPDVRPSATNAYGYSPQPAHAQPSYGQRDGTRSSSAARYTPGPGYAPSPTVNTSASIPPLPVASNSPNNPYNPADYASSNAGYQATPPSFTRQRSNSQPSFAPGSEAPYPTYIPPSAGTQQMAAYNEPSTRRGSTRPRREHRHRARSADTNSYSHSVKDRHEDGSRMAKVRDRLDGMDLREKGLAASVGGALAGGFAGRQLGKSRLTTLAGAAAGALGARGLATKSRSRSNNRRSSSRSRSRSRSRTRTHDRDRSKGTGLRARSRSVIDRFRSKSRGVDDRDSRRPDERDSRRDKHRDRDDRRPDHGYDYGRGDDYDYFSSASEGDGSPVHTRRHRRRDY